MTHMISLTHREARKLAGEGILHEVVESKKVKGEEEPERTSSYVLAGSSILALQHWAHYMNGHRPGWTLYRSIMSVKRAKVEDIASIDEIPVGAIAQFEELNDLGLGCMSRNLGEGDEPTGVAAPVA